ncbi:Nicotinamidase [Tolypocladium capitatum]|uniref:nicotinamidase n=1 Tax=Tolypocladium capitatum TaxID=45235 RepID=A0A2K3QHC8_9HYPO|nr:Nicotinamidase [Tolypocladium capitatum]
MEVALSPARHAHVWRSRRQATHAVQVSDATFPCMEIALASCLSAPSHLPSNQKPSTRRKGLSIPPIGSSARVAGSEPRSESGAEKRRRETVRRRRALISTPLVHPIVSPTANLARRQPRPANAMADAKPFKPALVVVDFQEDFCPPNGSLAVPGGRSIAPLINHLLALPFSPKLATRDWHPPNHTSFAANHGDAPPFTSTTTVAHPSDPSRSYSTTLWPVHCVQGSPGARLVSELDVARVDAVIDKGMDPRVEMYSAFYDPFRVSDSGLAERLRRAGVTDVFVVGLAADFCVRATAEHALDEGFGSYVVEEGTKPVLPDKWPECRRDMLARGVKMISAEGDDIARVKSLP